MLNKDSILRFSNSVLKRFEPDLDEGLIFFYHAEQGIIRIGNADMAAVAVCINGEKTVSQICDEILTLYKDLSPDKIACGVAETLSVLLKEGFIESVR